MSSASTSTSAAVVESTPPLSFAIRHKSGVRIYSVPELSVISELTGTNFAEIKYSRDGSLFAVVDADKGVQLFDAANAYAPMRVLSRQHISALAFSPRNGFLLTWERFNKATNEEKDNLLVWSIASGEIVAKFTQKQFNKTNWPTVLWSDDESLAARMVSSEVQFFAGDELKSIVGRIKLDNVTQFSFAPNGSAKAQVVATFSPEKKGSAALCRLFRYPECESPLNTKAFFNATDVTFQWNAKGNSLLLTSHTDVDSSGQSYYGVDRLYILSTDSSLAESVELKAEGSIHAVAWHSDGKSFAVCYGKMPAHTTFYSSRGKPIADLGQGSNNTLAYAPSGKVLLIGGFGNLQGEMGFWEPTKLKLFGRATAYCSSVQSWSPSSRHLLTAVLSPRIRVDNGFKLFTYAGKLVTDVAIPDLYDAMWRPALPGVYPVPQRPLSAQLIDPSDVAKLGAAAAAAAASSPAAAASAAVKVAAYVPPALRNRQGGGAPATSSVTAQLRAGQTTGVKFHAPKVVVPVGETPVDPYEAALSGEKKPKKKAAPKAAAPKKVEPAFVIEDPEF